MSKNITTAGPSSLFRLREPVNALTHLIGAAIALLGLIALMILGWGNLAKWVTLTLYGVSLTLMFLSSGVYHAYLGEPAKLLALRKLDHCAIYLQIAGTYTPVCYQYLDGAWRWGILGVIWLMAVSGIVVKLFIIRAPRWLTAGIYLVMGWLAVFAIREIIQNMPAGALTWLVAGGLFYTVGAVIYIAKRPNPFPNRFGFHEIWHIFVLLGAISHFVLVLAYIA